MASKKKEKILETDPIYASISNYYGTPYVRLNEEGMPVIGLENWDDVDEQPISKPFFNAWKKQFGPQKNGS